MRTLTFRRSLLPATLAATLLAAFVFLFAWPQPAAAHDELISSDPAAGATVETLPSELTLTFSAALIGGEGTTALEVLDADGESVIAGEPTVDGAMVTQPLIEEASAGEYQVVWKVLSSDGHPTDGEFGFTVTTSTISDQPTAAPTASPTESPSNTPSATPEASTAPEISTAEPSADADAAQEADSSTPWPWIIGIAIVVVIAIVVLLALSRRKRGSSDHPAER